VRVEIINPVVPTYPDNLDTIRQMPVLRDKACRHPTSSKFSLPRRRFQACVFEVNPRDCWFTMQAQDAATAYFFKLWEWTENNIRTVIIGAGVAAVVIALVSYYLWQQNQTEITAGQELTQLFISTPPDSDASQLADAYLKIAMDYPGTQSGKRAWVLAATTLFESGKYPEAQAQFQKYLDANPVSAFSATAALGVAASLEAQRKTQPAADAYQRVISSYSNPNAVAAAQFALAKINEQQGNLVQAENFYQQVARNNPNTALGSEAAFLAFQLKSKAAATQSTNTPATRTAPFSLNTEP